MHVLARGSSRPARRALGNVSPFQIACTDGDAGTLHQEALTRPPGRRQLGVLLSERPGAGASGCHVPVSRAQAAKPMLRSV